MWYNKVTINASAFTAANENTSIVIETADKAYTATAKVVNFAIGTLDEYKQFFNHSYLQDNTVNDYVVLTANIDASAWDNGSNITSWTFNGTFDGQGYTVTGAYGNWNGLFYNLGTSGVVKNVAFKGIRFRMTYIFGNRLEGTVENCYFQGVGGDKKATTPLFANQINKNAVIKNVVVVVTNNNADETKPGVFNSVMNYNASIKIETPPTGVYVVNDKHNGNIAGVNIGKTDLSGIKLYSTVEDMKAEVTELPQGFDASIWQMKDGLLTFKTAVA